MGVLMSKILERRETGGDGSLALDLSCGCTIVLPEKSRVLVTDDEFTCFKCDFGRPEMFANWPRDEAGGEAQ